VQNNKTLDIILWEKYKASKSPMDKDQLIKQLNPLIQKQVNKWAGNVPRNALETEAVMLASKGIDTYDPSKGAALSTHIMNAMAPLSRTVYTYQNTARIPENITLKLNTYNTAKDYLVTSLGRDPSTDELHQELGWGVNEMNRFENYVRSDLVESVGGLNEKFYGGTGSTEEDTLAAIYFTLMPNEKKLFEYNTGYNGTPILGNTEIMKKLNLSQAQYSYQKNLLMKKLEKLNRS